MDFIPDLHNDAAWQCIMRVPYDEFLNAAKVSRKWKAEIEGTNFHNIRRSVGVTQPAIVTVLSIDDPEEARFRIKGYNPLLPYQLVILNLKTGLWSSLPNIPELKDGIPPCCRLAGVGTELVVLGGIDPINHEIILDSVFIYNFISCEWRRGAPMPLQRLHFECASDSDRFIYVAGGGDLYDNPTKNLIVYDVFKDEWKELPNMAKECYPCQLLFSRENLQLFNDFWIGCDQPVKREVEKFDLKRSLWAPMFSDYTIGTGIYVDSGNGCIYKCDNEKVTAKKGDNWETIANFPMRMSRLYFATMWQGKLILIGSMEYLISEKGYILDEEYEYTEYKYVIEAYEFNMDNYSWKKLDELPECVDHFMESCFLEI